MLATRSSIPIDPIQVGVGVHAGEAVDTPDGPVGTAVNIAARLCAMAAPGEVVVSDTVRALTRSVGTAGFVPMGRRPIKGLDESLTVYRAVPAGAAAGRGRSRARRPRLASVALVSIVGGGALAVALLVVAQRPAPPAAMPDTSSHPSGAASSRPTTAASRTPVGVFATRKFSVPFRVALGPSWAREGEVADNVAFRRQSRPAGWIDAILVAATLDPPCNSTAPEFLGTEPKDVIDWLASRPWLDHTAPRPYNVGKYLGRSVDITVLSSDRWTCPATDDKSAAMMFRLGSPSSTVGFGLGWGADVGERKRVVAIDVDGRTVTLVIGSPYDDVAQLWTLAEPLLQSIQFTGSTP